MQRRGSQEARFYRDSVSAGLLGGTLAALLAALAWGSAPAELLSAWGGFCAGSILPFLVSLIPFTVALHEHGLTVRRGPFRFASRWLDIDRVDVTEDDKGELQEVEISSRRRSTIISGAWTPARDVVRVVVDRADLVETASPPGTTSYVRRQEPRTSWGNRRYRRRLTKQVKRHGRR